MNRLKTISSWLQAFFYIAAGLNHFLNPEFYRPMMPPWLPTPEFVHLFAGAIEIAGGAGLLYRPYSTKAAWLLIAVLVTIFPANLYVAMEAGAPMGISATLAWWRLPFQMLFIAWAYWHTKEPKGL